MEQEKEISQKPESTEPSEGKTVQEQSIFVSEVERYNNEKIMVEKMEQENFIIQPQNARDIKLECCQSFHERGGAAIDCECDCHLDEVKE